jgi:predicted transcriptional regulator YdeE
MKYESLQGPEFHIIGISARTTNRNDQSQKDIGELWTRFMEKGLIAQIPNIESSDIHCVYTDYESDHTGSYTAVVGCKVSSLEHIPEGFCGISVPSGKYLLFRPEGRFPDCVADAWRYIWDSDGERSRRYSADYDVYGWNADNPQSAKAEVYLSVR